MPSPNDADTLTAIGQEVDLAERTANLEWGYGRLADLVGVEWRTKLIRQTRRWSEAYQAAWSADMLTRSMLDDVRSAAGGMARAWERLGEVAREAGHQHLSPVILGEAELADGSILAIVRTDAEVAGVSRERNGPVYTLREVANVIDALPEALKVAKVIFPGSQILPQSDQGPWRKAGDSIPF